MDIRKFSTPPNLKKLIATLFSAITLLSPSSLLAEEKNTFSVRGRYLNMNMEEACGDSKINTSAPVRENIDNGNEKRNLSALGFVDINDSTCNLKLGIPASLNGIQTESDYLVGIDNKLIAMVYTIHHLSFDDAIIYVTSQSSKYGKPIKTKTTSNENRSVKYLWGNENRGDYLVTFVTITGNDEATIKTSLVRNPDFSQYKKQCNTNKLALEKRNLILRKTLTEIEL